MQDAAGAAPIKEGDVLAGKYRVESTIGQGGMGVVFAATHLAVGTRFAVKALLSHAALERVSRARFEREARAACQLKSEHAVRIFDVGTSDSGAPFFVMELLEGEDLEERCRRLGPLPACEVVALMRQACEALAEAHALGFVHRDVKPRNLFVVRGHDGSEHIKVLDFGISKQVETGELATLTGTSDLLGTPHYISPEQLAKPREVDARADLWGLGASMYRLLAGKRPFEAETIHHICARVLGETPEPLTRVRLDLPAALVRVVERCLEKDPAARYASALELAEALRPFLSLERSVVVAPSSSSETSEKEREPGRAHAALATMSSSLPRVGASWAPPPAKDEPALTTPPPAPTPSRRSRAWLAAPIGLGVAVAALAGWGATRPRSEASPPNASASVLPAAEPPHEAPGPAPASAETAAPLPAQSSAADAAATAPLANAKRPRRSKPAPPHASAGPSAAAPPPAGPPDVRH